MSENTSATGGYLEPVDAPDEGRDLTDFLRGVFSGLTGITFPGHIRALWQPTPPTVPEPTVSWLAFGIQTTDTEGISPYIALEEFEEGDTIFERVRQTQQETVDVNVQVYGLRCMALANAIRDGLNIGQNREAMKLWGLSYAGASTVRRVPEQVDSRWYDRADLTLTFRRQAERTYRVRSLVQAGGTVNDQNWQTETP